MAAFATLQQFEARFERELTTAQQDRVTALLDDASDIIRAQVPDLPDTPPTITVGVACAMVARVIRNPEGKRTETFGDDYAYQRDNSTSAGDLHLTETERKDVAAAVSGQGVGGSFSIAPLYPAAW